MLAGLRLSKMPVNNQLLTTLPMMLKRPAFGTLPTNLIPSQRSLVGDPVDGCHLSLIQESVPFGLLGGSTCTDFP